MRCSAGGRHDPCAAPPAPPQPTPPRPAHLLGHGGAGRGGEVHVVRAVAVLLLQRQRVVRGARDALLALAVPPPPGQPPPVVDPNEDDGAQRLRVRGRAVRGVLAERGAGGAARRCSEPFKHRSKAPPCLLRAQRPVPTACPAAASRISPLKRLTGSGKVCPCLATCSSC